MAPPRAFISYSWSSPEHEQWVLDLASDLVESGVDVILDKWELREGQDKFVFMERMVTDPDVGKVLVICDRKYAEKADARKGGVGTESQIISAEVYDKVDQRKFVPVVTEIDNDGKPTLPAYLRGRIYIDMSTAANRRENLEQLIRWIFDKPAFQKPQVGKPPSYITEDAAPQLGTASRQRTAIDAVRLGKPSALGAVEDYFDYFATNLEVLRVDRNASPYDDAVVTSVEHFRAYRDEAIDVVLNVAKFRDDREVYDIIHRWLERMLLYKFPPTTITSWRDQEFDNYKFVLNETFLYVIAALLKARRFTQARWLMETKYFIPAVGGRSEARSEPFDTFRDYIRSLNDVRNERLKLNRLSVVSDMFKQRATRPDLPFEEVMQADFVLLVYSVLHFPGEMWFPNTLIYASHGRSAFELFARGASKRYFAKTIAELFEIASKEELLSRFKENGSGVNWHHLWQWDGFDPYQLMNAAKLETEP